MVKPIRRSLARRLGRNMRDRRRAVGLTQEQIAEYLDINTLTVSHDEMGNIISPLTVADIIAKLLAEKALPPLEHFERMGIWLSSLPVANRDWIESVVKQLVQRSQPRPRGRPRTRATAAPSIKKSIASEQA